MKKLACVMNFILLVFVSAFWIIVFALSYDSDGTRFAHRFVRNVSLGGKYSHFRSFQIHANVWADHVEKISAHSYVINREWNLDFPFKVSPGTSGKKWGFRTAEVILMVILRGGSQSLVTDYVEMWCLRKFAMRTQLTAPFIHNVTWWNVFK